MLQVEKLRAVLGMLAVALVCIGTSLPRQSDEKRGTRGLDAPGANLEQTFEVRVHAQTSVSQDLHGTCRIRAIEGLSPDQQITVRVRLEDLRTGKLEENERSFATADIPAGAEDWEMPAVGLSMDIGCPTGADCARSFAFSCARVDDVEKAKAEVDWQLNAEVVYEAPLFGCEPVDVRVEMVEL